METQRILMRSLAVVVFASVIWTITDSAPAKQKTIRCCKFVSSLTREQFTDPIISFMMLKQSPPCQKAIILETERGEFCFDWRLPWVQEEVRFLRDQRNNYLTSTLTPEGGQTNLSCDSTGAEKEIIFCKDVSGQTREQFTDPIIGIRMPKRSNKCVKAVVLKTERGEFCFNWILSLVKHLLRAHYKA